ncbi:hypothetical protein [Desulfobacula sp.]|uniref:hypothetical protein n=1 Tax=Desulfobacula sp. TaxID=2593537 RepID=UPI002617536A|nr:hypothetical protein [Desulfobacula sp.]
MATLQQIIANLPIGKRNAMKVSDFEQTIGNQDSGTNNDQTRREVKSAIYDNDIPVGSSSHAGYWLIDSDEEFQEIIDRLNSTIDQFTAKRDAIERGWQKRKQSKASEKPWPK